MDREDIAKLLMDVCETRKCYDNDLFYLIADWHIEQIKKAKLETIDYVIQSGEHMLKHHEEKKEP